MKLFKKKEKVKSTYVKSNDLSYNVAMTEHLKQEQKSKTKPSLGYDANDLKKIPKKRRKNALRLLDEYNKGLVIQVDKEVDQKAFIKNLREAI